MRKRIQNTLKINCDGLDLTTATNIEFYVRQNNFFRCYTPSVISPSEMVVVIPLEDAMELGGSMAELQFAYTDENGNPKASEICSERVKDLLKEAGYGSI